MLADEATAKLDTPAPADMMQPLQAFDSGARARTAAQVVELLATAKESGVDPEKALALVNWES